MPVPEETRRILAVLSGWPWPPRSGAQLRMAHLVAALAELGTLDVFVLAAPDADAETALRAAVPVAEVGAAAPGRVPVPGARLRWVTRPDLPFDLARIDATEAQAAFARWRAGRSWDLCFCYGLHSHHVLGDALGGPVLVDLADLHHVFLDRRAEAATAAGRSPGWLSRFRTGVDVGRWRRLERRTAAAVAGVTVCSAEDRDGLDVAGTVVVPNGCDVPDEPLTPAPGPARSEPVLLYPGLLTYGPNEDAAELLAREILPLVRAEVPDARVALVGRCSERVAGLGAEPGVEVVGEVEAMAPQLARAAVEVVPLLSGSGTRLKVLEAWAAGVPVVSTTLGAEGLGAVDGDDVLLADDVDGLAAACVRLLRDPELAAAMRARGRARAEEHDWRRTLPVFAALAARLADDAAVPSAAAGSARSAPPWSPGRLQAGLRVRRTVLAGRDGRTIGRYLAGRLGGRDRRVVVATLLAAEEAVVEFERHGTTWRLATGDGVFGSVFVDGAHQGADLRAVVAWARRHRGDRPAALDVGANMGTTAVPLAQQGLRVLAVEPVPANIGLLAHNVAANGLDGLVTVVHAAVHDEPGPVTVAVAAGPGQAEVVAGAAPAFVDTGVRHVGDVTAPARELDDLVAEAGLDASAVLLVWADTQGSEGAVVRTGSALWADGVPLFLEVWPAALARHQPVDRFVADVTDRFAGFVPVGRLRAEGAAAPVTPIERFAGFVAAIDDQTDVLLVPEPPAAGPPGAGPAAGVLRRRGGRR